MAGIQKACGKVRLLKYLAIVTRVVHARKQEEKKKKKEIFAQLSKLRDLCIHIHIMLSESEWIK